jgi:hypothetical protein
VAREQPVSRRIVWTITVTESHSAGQSRAIRSVSASVGHLSWCLLMLVLFSKMFTLLGAIKPVSTGTSPCAETGCVWVATHAAICGDLQCGDPYQCVDSDHVSDIGR